MPLSTVLSVNEYTDGNNRRKGWEIDKALQTLYKIPTKSRHRALGVGAGKEYTIYHLLNIFEEVHATDLYASGGVWSDSTAPSTMLTDPELHAPLGNFNFDRLIVQHMDGTRLRYPDNYFDGVFSSGSVEHFGEWGDIQRAFNEIYRVLKPNGIASISTEYKISGNGDGWAGTKLFDDERLRQMVEASKLSWYDPLNTNVDSETMNTRFSLSSIIKGNIPPIEGVLEQDNFIFTSVHLALQKVMR